VQAVATPNNLKIVSPPFDLGQGAAVTAPLRTHPLPQFPGVEQRMPGVDNALSRRLFLRGTGAAAAAVAGAQPLRHNAWKLPILSTLVRRSVLSAADVQETVQ
jgi:hypothetical protein